MMYESRMQSASGFCFIFVKTIDKKCYGGYNT